MAKLRVAGISFDHMHMGDLQKLSGSLMIATIAREKRTLALLPKPPKN